MHLLDILYLYSKFHYITYKEQDWSVVDWGCSCVACLRDCVCSHSTLVGMFFNPSLSVPDPLEQTVPSVCKNAMLTRGIAGSKHKRCLAAKALETKKSNAKCLSPSIVVWSAQGYSCPLIFLQIHIYCCSHLRTGRCSCAR